MHVITWWGERNSWKAAPEKTVRGAAEGHRNRMIPCALQLYTEYINRLLKTNQMQKCILKNIVSSQRLRHCSYSLAPSTAQCMWLPAGLQARGTLCYFWARMALFSLRSVYLTVTVGERKPSHVLIPPRPKRMWSCWGPDPANESPLQANP